MLTLLFAIFILFATQVLSLVPTLCLNHWLYSFLRLLRLLEGPHVGRAPSFAAELCLSEGLQIKTDEYVKKNPQTTTIYFTQNIRSGNNSEKQPK